MQFKATLMMFLQKFQVTFNKYTGKTFNSIVRRIKKKFQKIGVNRNKKIEIEIKQKKSIKIQKLQIKSFNKVLWKFHEKFVIE